MSCPHADEAGGYQQDNSKRCAALATDNGLDAHGCLEELPFVCQRPDLPLPAFSQTHNFETCQDSFHKEGCAAGAAHLAFSPPPSASLARGCPPLPALLRSCVSAVLPASWVNVCATPRAGSSSGGEL